MFPMPNFIFMQVYVVTHDKHLFVCFLLMTIVCLNGVPFNSYNAAISARLPLKKRYLYLRGNDLVK